MRAVAGVWVLLCAAFCAAAALAQPTLQASVDRATVQENESFTYVIRAEGALRGEPDASPLEREFDVLQRTSSSRAQILNGEVSQVTEWTYQLMPRSTGKFTLPGLRVGNSMTNAVELEVLPAEAAGDAPGDIFMEVATEPDVAYVQSQVVYTLRLFVGVSTGRASLTPPEVSGGEAIIERLGEDRQYQTSRSGRDFVVRERRYAVFPQQPGKLTLGPVTFEAMVIPSRGFSRVQRFRSAAVEIDVQGAVPPPASMPNAVWLPAASVRLSERWSEQGDLPAGVPRTRTLVIEADGVLETQLPELELPAAAGIRQYADQPELQRDVTAQGLRARRTERYAVLAQSPGEIVLPGVELPWFDVTEGRWQVARLDPQRLTVLPGAEPAVMPPEPVSNEALAPPPAAPGGAGWWPAVSGVLALGWLATAVLWWRSGRGGRVKRVRRPQASPAHVGERRLRRRLRAACEADDAVEARRLLLEWAEAKFAPDPPRSLGALAALLPPDAAGEVRALEAHIYGAAAGRPWSGAGLRAALAAVDAVTRPGQDARSDTLSPLYR